MCNTGKCPHEVRDGRNNGDCTLPRDAFKWGPPWDAECYDGDEALDGSEVTKAEREAMDRRIKENNEGFYD